MMKSMTGFAFTEQNDETFSFSALLKAYNHRYLDIFITLPESCISLEPRIREYLKAKIKRGKVEFSLKENLQNSKPKLYLNEELYKTYAQLFRKMIQIQGLEDKPRLNHFLRVEGLLESSSQLDPESGWLLVQPALEKLFKNFEAQRCKEGHATQLDILSKLQGLEEKRIAILEGAEQASDKFKNSLRERFEEVMGDQIDENRILAETAVLLARYDINEELIRLESHFTQMKEIIKKEECVGKKLDFLCQEINREINTIGSKASEINIQQAVVSMKDNLEMIREQLRNVE